MASTFPVAPKKSQAAPEGTATSKEVRMSGVKLCAEIAARLLLWMAVLFAFFSILIAAGA